MDHQEEEDIDDEPAPVVYESDIGSGERTEGEKETLKMILQVPVQGADRVAPAPQEPGQPDQDVSPSESGI